MRHRYSGKYLNRATPHRMALLRNMASSLISKEAVETTLAKAKAVQPYIEKLVTKAKTGTNKFNTVKFLKTKLATDTSIRKLINELAPKYKDRNGGYTKVTKTGNRRGDNALTARIEFIVEKTKSSSLPLVKE